MAADWIKMRTDLQTHPKIVRILSATRADKFRVVGGLHAVWAIFDAHSVDGVLKGYTPDLLDHVIGWEGFARAMESVGWLTYDGLETLALPEFEAHNGQSAKRRAEDQKRKRDARKSSDSRPDSVRDGCGQNADGMRTRGEERRVTAKSIDSPNGESLSAAPSEEDRTVNIVLDCYHAALPNCQRVEAMTPKRRKRILTANKLAKAMCKQQGWQASVRDFWTAYFTECLSDPWLRGDVPNPNSPRWKQNLFTLVDEERFGQIMDQALAKLRRAA